MAVESCLTKLPSVTWQIGTVLMTVRLRTKFLGRGLKVSTTSSSCSDERNTKKGAIRGRIIKEPSFPEFKK